MPFDLLGVVRGTTSTFGISVIEESTGEPYALEEGQTLVFGLKRAELSEDRLFTKKVTHRVGNEYYLELSPEDTADLEPGKYFFDVGMQQGLSLFFNVVRCSPFYIFPNVTKLGDGL